MPTGNVPELRSQAPSNEKRIMMEAYDEQNKRWDPNPVMVPVSRLKEAMKDGLRVSRRSLSRSQRIQADIADWLPTVGGITGGAIGGAAGLAEFGIGAVPGTIVGSAGGQAVGQAGREAVYRNLGLVDAPGSVGQQALVGGVSGLGGVILGKAAEGAGGLLMNTALGKSAYKTAETVAEALKSRIPVGKVVDLGKTVWSKIPGIKKLGETGMQKLQPIIERYSSARDVVLGRLAAAGYKTTYQSFVDDATAYINKMREAGQTEAADQALSQLKSFMTRTRGTLDPKTGIPGKVLSRGRKVWERVSVGQAQKFTTAANNQLEEYYAKLGLGKKAPLDPQHTIVKMWGDAHRNWLREIDEIETALNGGIIPPGIREKTLEQLNARFGSLLNLKSVLGEAEKKGALGRLQETSMGTAGAGMAAGAAGAALTGGGSAVGTGAAIGAGLGVAPAIASRTALTLTSPATQALLRYGVPGAGQLVGAESLKLGPPKEPKTIYSFEDNIRYQ